MGHVIMAITKGTKVQALFGAGAEWFDGTITEVVSRGFHIRYDDGAPRFVFRIARPSFLFLFLVVVSNGDPSFHRGL